MNLWGIISLCIMLVVGFGTVWYLKKEDDKNRPTWYSMRKPKSKKGMDRWL